MHLMWSIVLSALLPIPSFAVAAPPASSPSARASDAELTNLIRGGAIRPARVDEEQRLRSIVKSRGRQYYGPLYVVRRSFAPVQNLNGSNAVSFLVPSSVRIQDYGETHSTFYRPSGECLHGAYCPVCPPGSLPSPGQSVLTATAAGCVPIPTIMIR